MGIKHGANLYAFFKYGLYRKDAKKIKLYVDGENLRHKGKISVNTLLHVPEPAIAKTSVDYLYGLVLMLERIFRVSIDPSNVIVFMDGKRVANKCARPSSQFKESFIRNEFMRCCENCGFTVKRLLYGESEMQMYAQRDRENELNIFVSTDSDMFGICYGHTPVVKSLCSDGDGDHEFDFNFRNLKIQIPKRNVPGFYDDNFNYPDLYEVKDSCLWISTKPGRVEFIGFDYAHLRLEIKPTVFRTLIAMCGTDFNDYFITHTMLDAILTPNDCNREFNLMVLNEQKDIINIAAGLIYMGIRYGGHLRVSSKTASNSVQKSNLDYFRIILKRYVQYITSYEMDNCAPPEVNPVAIVRRIIMAMSDGKTSLVRSKLRVWCQLNALETVLHNFETNKTKMYTGMNVYNEGDSNIHTSKNDNKSNSTALSTPNIMTNVEEKMDIFNTENLKNSDCANTDNGNIYSILDLLDMETQKM